MEALLQAPLAALLRVLEIINGPEIVMLVIIIPNNAASQVFGPHSLFVLQMEILRFEFRQNSLSTARSGASGD